MTVNWKRRSYTPEQFQKAWETSLSLRQVALKLGKNGDGNIYYILRSAAQDLGLTEDHMIKDRLELARKVATIPLIEILVEDSTYTNTDRLRKRLIAAGLKDKKCEICDITEWCGAQAPLALDHINGVRRDNRIENLRILCYNCHGQTSTYGSKVRPSGSATGVCRGAVTPSSSDMESSILSART